MHVWQEPSLLTISWLTLGKQPPLAMYHILQGRDFLPSDLNLLKGTEGLPPGILLLSATQDNLPISASDKQYSLETTSLLCSVC